MLRAVKTMPLGLLQKSVPPRPAQGVKAMRIFAKTGMAILAQAALLSPAAAQSIPNADAAIDRAEAQLDRMTGPSSGSSEQFFVSGDGSPSPQIKPEPRWTLSSEAAFTYSDNVNLAQTGQLGSAHLATSASLGREFKLSKSTTLVLSVRSDFDFLTDHSELDTSGWTANAKLTFGNPSEQLAPYVQAISNGIYSGQFESHIVTTHLYGVGAVRKFKLMDGGVLSLDFNVMRREASLITSEVNRGQLTVGYLGIVAPKLKWSIGARLRYLDYTGGTASNREDVQLRLAGGLSYEVSPALSLNANLVLARNWSTVLGKSYSNVDVGPGLFVTTKF